MSQEEKIIKVHLEKREKEDYLVFQFEETKDVCLNKETSQNDLRAVFANLLTELLKAPLKLEFEDKLDYKTGLYIDVCKEYIKDLNREISSIRKNIPEKLIMKNIS